MGLHLAFVASPRQVLDRLHDHTEELVAPRTGQFTLESVPVLPHKAPHKIIQALPLNTQLVFEASQGVITTRKSDSLDLDLTPFGELKGALFTGVSDDDNAIAYQMNPYT